MSWLLAWLILNAIIFVWRLLVAVPEIKTERQLVGAKRSLAFIDRAKVPPSAPPCGSHVAMLSLHELFLWLASVWSTSRREDRSRPRKPQTAQRHRATSDTS